MMCQLLNNLNNICLTRDCWPWFWFPRILFFNLTWMKVFAWPALWRYPPITTVTTSWKKNISVPGNNCRQDDAGFALYKWNAIICVHDRISKHNLWSHDRKIARPNFIVGPQSQYVSNTFSVSTSILFSFLLVFPLPF